MKLKPVAEQNEQTVKLASRIKDRFSQLEQKRMPHEENWRRIAQWMFPRRSFTIERAGNALVRRRIVDTTAIRSGGRLAALLQGYLIDTHEPFVEPWLGRRRMAIAAKRPAEMRWLESVEHDMFRFLTGSRSTFRAVMMESLTDDVFFGNSVIWTGASRLGGRPVYKSLALFECYWDENGEGVVDTLYRRFKLTLKNAYALYPTPKLKEKTEVDKPKWDEEFTFIHAVEPRANGERGAIATRKPWSATVYNLDTDEIAEHGGFDTFPFSVTRYQKQAGDVYGTGAGWEALPQHVLLNHMSEDILIAAEDQARPALVDWSGRLKKLDRRAGAFNSLNAAELMLMEPGQIVTRLHDAGDPRFAVDYAVQLRAEIEFTFFVDWMRRLEGQPPSATQVHDDRDIRFKSLSGVMSRIEPEKMTPCMDVTYEVMAKAEEFDPAPESLDGADIDFLYRSPLTIAQKQTRLEQIGRSLTLIEGMAALDEGVTDIPDMDAIARDGLDAAGLGRKYTRTPDMVAARRKKRADDEEEARQLDNAAAAAGAARDAGQAIASVAPGAVQ